MHEHDLLAYLERIGTLLRAEQRAAGGPHGLQAVHVAVLKYLHQCNRYSNTPAALTAFLGLTKGTVSQTLKVLERGGYIRRTDDNRDGRVVRLALTRKGHSVLSRTDQAGQRGGAVDGVPDADFEVTRHVLQVLLRHMQLSNGYRTFGQCATCRHLLHEGNGHYRCGLTREELERADTAKICFEHEPPAAA